MHTQAHTDRRHQPRRLLPLRPAAQANNPDTITQDLNPRTIRLAEAFFDIEDDMNIAFRQSRLAGIALEHVLVEVRALSEIAKQRGDACTEYHLRQITRDLSAVFDAVTEADGASGRIERRYYEADKCEAAA
ncbi:hypothetical protein [Shinella granuli]|uniref:Uncharacterized protein n=1 Tax=Shinella granuli TaxID=323621 RepID=A0A4R2DA58_SHIGR|nr:hypothetical protein [Shinella granuli]TCN48879.1 hypothetical protein EV665_101618 [Shinella granuli]